MLSILIPTYNYNALPLAETIEHQALSLGIPFEIICIDDGSFSELNIHNQKINSLTNSKFIETKTNLGSINNRLELAQNAQYKWLLFIDSDTIPKQKDFLSNYLNYTSNSYDAIFGGLAYKNDILLPSKTLRYLFGKQREEISAEQRNRKPYKVIFSSNFLIKKAVFQDVLQNIGYNTYGLDYLFGAKLKERKFKVHHIDNEVYHLGLDNDRDYLIKVKKAVNILFELYQSKTIKKHDISLLKAYILLKNFGLKHFTSWLFARFKSAIEANLLSGNPNLRLFDFYRLGHLCSLKESSKQLEKR